MSGCNPMFDPRESTARATAARARSRRLFVCAMSLLGLVACGRPIGGMGTAGDAGCQNPCDCCPANQVCSNGACCEPRCDGLTCGDDGCGGSCACRKNWTCNSTARCECEQAADELCREHHQDCGALNATDECGVEREVVCDLCVAPQTCQPDGTCVCVPDDALRFCNAQGALCGPVTATDNCGAMRIDFDCGNCPAEHRCQGGACVCVPEDDASFCGRLQAACGTVVEDDNCGSPRTAECGSCGPGEMCDGATHRCVCAPDPDATLCARVSRVCGSALVLDNCGLERTIDCGRCPASFRCDDPGICNPCTAQSDAQLCAFHGRNCGSPSLVDDCGETRTPPCGSCTSPRSCQPDHACAVAGEPTNDTCASPERLRFQGAVATVSGSTATAVGDTQSQSCGGMGGEVVYSLDLNARSDVSLTLAAGGSLAPVLYVRSSCDLVSSEKGCSSVTTPGGVATVTLHLDPGRYFVFADSFGVTFGPFSLTVALGAPTTSSPANEVCATAQPMTLVGGQASVTGDTAGAVDDTNSTCARIGGSGDVFYSFTLAATSSVVATARRQSTSPAFVPVVYLRSACASSATIDQKACAAANATDGVATATVPRLAPGTYYAIVDGKDGTFGAFTLELTATTPVPNDTCAGALPVLVDSSGLASINGDTTLALDDAASGCLPNATGPDLVYSVEVPPGAPVRAEFEVLPSSTSMAPMLSLRSNCLVPSSELTCVKSAAASATRLVVPRLGTGTYYLWVDGNGAGASGSFTLDVQLTAAPAGPANDLCASPVVLDANGSTVRASTVGAYDDYLGGCSSGTNQHNGADLTYSFTLATSRTVAVQLTRDGGSPSFRPAVYLRSTCALGSSQLACANETNGAATLLRTGLAAGTYFLLVDGIAGTAGDFALSLASYDAVTNDTCATATALSFDVNGDAVVAQDTASAVDNSTSHGGGNCSVAGTSGDFVYSFVLTEPTHVTMTETALTSTLRPMVYLRRGDHCTTDVVPGVQEIGCNLAPVGGAAALSFKFLRPGTYWLWADSIVSQTGPFLLRVHKTPVVLSPNDTCAAAAALIPDATGHARATGDLDAASNDGDGSCASGSGADLVYSFTLAQRQAVSITVAPTPGSTLKPVAYLRTACGPSGFEKGCVSSVATVNPVSLNVPALDPGTYYLVVDSSSGVDTGPFTLDVRLATAQPTPANDLCANATPLTWVGLSASAFGNTAVASDTETSFCSTNAKPLTGPDLVYSFELTAATSVKVRVVPWGSTLAYHPAVSVRRSCAPRDEVACAVGSQYGDAQADLYTRLGAGTWYVFVDGVGSATAGSEAGAFTLDVLNLGTAGLAADSCSSPGVVAIDPVTQTGTVSGVFSPSLVNDAVGSCLPSSGEDLVYQLILTDTSDVSVALADAVGGQSSNAVAFLRTVCNDPASERGCASTSTPGTKRFAANHLSAGTYYLWLDSRWRFSGGPFEATISVTPAPPVPANDTCAGVATIAFDAVGHGAQLLGDTSGAADDFESSCLDAQDNVPGSSDVVYRFVLPQAARVYASVASVRSNTTAYYPAIYLRSTCSGPTATVDLACAGMYLGGSAGFYADLQAGTYYLVVDGLRGTFGKFVLQVAWRTSGSSNDTCATAEPLTFDSTGLAVAAGSTFGMSDDFQGSCRTDGDADVVYSFTLTARKRVALDLISADPVLLGTAAWVRDGCGQGSAEYGCSWVSPNAVAHVGIASLAAGTYYLFVDSAWNGMSGAFTLGVRLEDPQPPPSWDTCAGARVLNMPASGAAPLVLTDTTADALDDFGDGCRPRALPARPDLGMLLNGPDLVYTFTLATNSRVSAELTGSADGMWGELSIRSTCPSMEPGVCAAGPLEQVPAQLAASLPAGTYFLVVDGVNAGYGPFDLRLSQNSSAYVEGDDCFNPISLDSSFQPTTGGWRASYSGTVSALFNDNGTSLCQPWSYGPDAVFSFTTSATYRITARLTPTTGNSASVYLRSGCSVGTELACQGTGMTGQVQQATTPRAGPGTYLVWVDDVGPTSAAYDLEVTLDAPIAAPGNDTCAGATPLTLGLTASGDTTAANADYFPAGAAVWSSACGASVSKPVGRDVVFSFNPSLSRSYYVTVTPSGWNAALWYSTGNCGDAAACSAIRDSGYSGAAESLYVPLTAGVTYFIYVSSTDGALTSTNWGVFTILVN